MKKRPSRALPPNENPTFNSPQSLPFFIKADVAVVRRREGHRQAKRLDGEASADHRAQEEIKYNKETAYSRTVVEIA